MGDAECMVTEIDTAFPVLLLIVSNHNTVYSLSEVCKDKDGAILTVYLLAIT